MTAETDKGLARLREPFPAEHVGLLPNTADPGRRRLRNAPVIERLMFRTVVDPSGCWLWLGATNKKGYGHIRGDLGGPLISVHRVVWEHVHGPIPEGLEIDHVRARGCMHRNCVNPAHLEAVDHPTNVARRRRATHCTRGHEYAPGSFTVDKRHGGRNCRRCATERMRAWREARAS